MRVNTYMATFRFEAAAIAIESPLVREVPTRLAREIIIKCPNAILKNRARLIARLVKEINKKKS